MRTINHGIQICLRIAPFLINIRIYEYTHTYTLTIGKQKHFLHLLSNVVFRVMLMFNVVFSIAYFLIWHFRIIQDNTIYAFPLVSSIIKIKIRVAQIEIYCLLPYIVRLIVSVCKLLYIEHSMCDVFTSLMHKKFCKFVLTLQ